MVSITPRKTAMLLGLFVAILASAHCAGLISKYYFGHGSLFGLVRFFDLDREGNLPTLFATFLLLLCSSFLVLIGIIHRENGVAWKLWGSLALIFAFLAVDEFTVIHENLIEPVGALLDTSGVFLYAWIIPYGILLTAFLLLYARFILEVPTRPRQFMLIAGTLYVGGAIGLEMVGGWYHSSKGVDAFSPDWIYGVIITLEELLELFGLVTFIYALLLYIETVLGGVNIQIGGKNIEPLNDGSG